MKTKNNTTARAYPAVVLESVGSVLDSQGMVYPLNEDGSYDISLGSSSFNNSFTGVELEDCSPEWWSRIDVKDRAACIDWAKNAGERGHGTIPGPLLWKSFMDFVAKERPAAMKETPEPTGPWATQDDYI